MNKKKNQIKTLCSSRTMSTNEIGVQPRHYIPPAKIKLSRNARATSQISHDPVALKPQLRAEDLKKLAKPEVGLFHYKSSLNVQYKDAPTVPLNPNIPTKNHKKIVDTSLVAQERHGQPKINELPSSRERSKAMISRNQDTSPKLTARINEDKENFLTAKGRRVFGVKYKSPNTRQPFIEVEQLGKIKSARFAKIIHNNLAENPEEIEILKTPLTKINLVENSEMSVSKASQPKIQSLRDQILEVASQINEINLKNRLSRHEIMAYQNSLNNRTDGYLNPIDFSYLENYAIEHLSDLFESEN